jgi:hypothetical protein
MRAFLRVSASAFARKLALVLLAGFLGYRAFTTIGDGWRLVPGAARVALGATRHVSDLRWAAARGFLPQRGMVQYAWSPGEDTALAYQAQFSLAPLVLTLEPAPGRLLVEDSAVHRRAAGVPPPGFELVHRGPDGISVWQNLAQSSRPH